MGMTLTTCGAGTMVPRPDKNWLKDATELGSETKSSRGLSVPFTFCGKLPATPGSILAPRVGSGSAVGLRSWVPNERFPEGGKPACVTGVSSVGKMLWQPMGPAVLNVPDP